MSRDITPFGLRMPSDLKARVDAAAESNGRSINAECVARLQESFEARADLTALPVGVLLDEIIQRLGARVQIVIAKEVAVQEGIDRE
jgi:hypothetical protein